MRIEGLQDFGQLTTQKKQQKEVKSFGDVLQEFVADVNADLKNAKEAEKLIAEGKVENLENLLYQIAKSDISLRLITEIRNKALESYQEIMRMQV
ncbi:flagellar hook-basal body complex protein FliE [Persephonella hydrogeniphila]|uniref:Flagellar hook-basal body complex protein FliE n=1 Tax=Persephonella hydrogeniphila TaxID=198703 RepID=A0A285NF13_9AQUI|nr:flagellar hook-basal body complex protein FliE [Persephonella hydrogeniphila]SNZ08104.1 flagellar hook-basal body complex protein FliE [Persephonella hydrogeniphila]